MLEKSKIIIYIIYLHKSIVIDPTHHVKKVFFINNSYSLTLSRLGGRGVESYPLYFFLRGFKYVACGIHPPPPFNLYLTKNRPTRIGLKVNMILVIKKLFLEVIKHKIHTNKQCLESMVQICVSLENSSFVIVSSN